VYWQPIYNLLEGQVEVWLVNAHHVKQVPGRKTDVKDAEWLAQLLQRGLVRYRQSVVEERNRVANRLQKDLVSSPHTALLWYTLFTDPARPAWPTPTPPGLGRGAEGQSPAVHLGGSATSRLGVENGIVYLLDTNIWLERLLGQAQSAVGGVHTVRSGCAD
jgi:hypothetical protein